MRQKKKRNPHTQKITKSKEKQAQEAQTAEYAGVDNVLANEASKAVGSVI